MPAPTVFISSTFYDLRYIRENLEFFVRSLGYNPILSEKGSIYYDPERSAANAAVAEVASCQLFVLVIGGRFGTEGDSGHSVTNAEYKEAVRQEIPIFALVEQGAYSDYDVWRANVSPEGETPTINYPNVDDPRVLEFIDEVRHQTINNALFPFRDFEDIQTYLRQQWSGMLHSFLLRRNEEKRVEETLGALERIGRRVEVLSRQILESVGSAEAKATAQMYDLLLGSAAVQDMTTLGLRPSPSDVLEHESFFECTESLGGHWEVQPEDADIEYNTSFFGNQGKMSFSRASAVKEDYQRLRQELTSLLEASGMSAESLSALPSSAAANPEDPHSAESLD